MIINNIPLINTYQQYITIAMNCIDNQEIDSIDVTNHILAFQSFTPRLETLELMNNKFGNDQADNRTMYCDWWQKSVISASLIRS